MLLRPLPSRRRAASMVESAIACSILLLFVLGVVIVGMGLFYYQQVQALAREGARYASVRGADYANDTHNPMATQTSVINNAILPRAVGLDQGQLTNNTSVVWDDASENPTYDNGTGNVMRNYVTVTIDYTWSPALYFSPVTFHCQSRMMQQY
jgi:Flp pilus assembly protein TadG